MKFSIYIALWGDEFIRSFMQDILPLHFSKGNLYAFLENNISVDFVFYTLTHDVKKISHYSSFKTLEAIMPVSIYGVETRHKDKFYLLTELHNLAILDAQVKDSTIIIFYADVVFSEGYFARLIKLRNSGYRAVLTFPISANKQEFLASYQLSNGREFVNYALSHMHNELKVHTWTDNSVCRAPNYFVAFLDNKNCLMHSFHWVPIMIAPTVLGVQGYYTIDTDFVRRACPEYETLYLVTDSDDLPMVSLLDKEELRENIEKISGDSVNFYANWSVFGADKLHLELFKEKIWYHYDDLNEQTLEIEIKADRIIEKIFAVRRKINNIFSKIIELSKKRPIIIFGAGLRGQLLSISMIFNDTPVYAIYDNNPNKWGIHYGPVPVMQPNYEKYKEFFIVIAADRYIEISKELKCHDLVYEKDFIVVNQTSDRYLEMELLETLERI